MYRFFQYYEFKIYLIIDKLRKFTLSTLSNFDGLFYSLVWIELKLYVGVKWLKNKLMFQDTVSKISQFCLLIDLL